MQADEWQLARFITCPYDAIPGFKAVEWDKTFFDWNFRLMSQVYSYSGDLYTSMWKYS
jgi:hypothetical protein